MATVIRKTDPLVQDMADTRNLLKLQIGAGSKAHLDVSEVTVTAADGDGTLAKALLLVNQMRAVSLFHRADALAHKAVDAATITAPVATTLATAITLANELKSDHATHIASATIHFNADATNVITASNATDQASLDTLLNDIKVQYNAHMGATMAPTNVVPSLRVVDA